MNILNSKVALDGGPVGDFVSALEQLTVGESLIVPGLFPGLSSDTQLVLLGHTPPGQASGKRAFSMATMTVHTMGILLGTAQFSICAAGYVLQVKYQEEA
jgi:hypothetical protein